MLLTMDVKEALQELAEAVKRLIAYRINKYGVNQRIGKNTLKGSNLEASIQVTAEEDGIALQIADYWGYVSKGWKRTGNGKKNGLYHELVLWALRKRIRFDGMTGISQNEAAVMVAEIVWTKMIVWKRPIAGRPFMIYDEEGEEKGEADLEIMIPELHKYIDKWFENLFNAIMEETDKYFN